MSTHTKDGKSTNRFEMLVGLHVTDEGGYQRYRDGMTPILEGVGGCFRYDFRVSEMLKGDTDQPINRVFVLSFPDESSADSMFGNEEYQKVRDEHFVGSVGDVSRIASYNHL